MSAVRRISSRCCGSALTRISINSRSTWSSSVRSDTLMTSMSLWSCFVTCSITNSSPVTKQLHKLIDVIKVSDLTDDDHVERELMLIRVNAEPQHRAEIMRTADIFRAKIVDVTPQSFTIEATGEEGKLEALVELLRPMG